MLLYSPEMGVPFLLSTDSLLIPNSSYPKLLIHKGRIAHFSRRTHPVTRHTTRLNVAQLLADRLGKTI